MKKKFDSNNVGDVIKLLAFLQSDVKDMWPSGTFREWINLFKRIWLIHKLSKKLVKWGNNDFKEVIKDSQTFLINNLLLFELSNKSLDARVFRDCKGGYEFCHDVYGVRFTSEEFRSLPLKYQRLMYYSDSIYEQEKS